MTSRNDDSQPAQEAPSDEGFAAAEAALAALSGPFRDWAGMRLDAVEAALDALGADAATVPPSGRAMAALSGLAHDLKGAAGGVGFDLVSMIAHSLAGRLRAASGADRSVPLSTVRLYLRSIRTVIDHDIRGDGGAKGAVLLERLDGLPQD